jgi:predicted transcriptional regulator
MPAGIKLRSLTLSYPTPKEVKEARLKAGFTKRECAEMVYISTMAWTNAELSRVDDRNVSFRKLHPGLAELFAIKAGIHPIYGIKTPPEREGE